MNSIHAVQLVFLALILCVGLAGFVFFRSRRARLLAFGGIIFLGIGLLSTFACMIWDGGFCQAEFRITFRDSRGNPVEGVELRVENEDGFEFFHYPVTDYLPEQVPRSDRNGVLTFHHATYFALEFSGRCYHLFFVIPVGEHSGPVYVCRFLHHGEEVYRVRYNDLNAEAWASPTVKRHWKWPEWPHHVMEEQYRACGDWNAVRLRLFDKNGNGKLERNEGAACGAAVSAHEKTWNVKQGRKSPEDDLEFSLVEKVVTVRASPQ